MKIKILKKSLEKVLFKSKIRVFFSIGSNVKLIRKSDRMVKVLKVK